MVSKQKRKGHSFEKQIVEYLNEELDDANFKVVPGSGALGTQLHEAGLAGDVKGKIRGWPGAIKAECKFGYGNKVHPEVKSLRVEKEWLDKISDEAALDYSFPLFFGKFENARNGTKIFVCMDVTKFVMLANYITKVVKELEDDE
jgi:hypothetical protein